MIYIYNMKKDYKVIIILILLLGIIGMIIFWPAKRNNFDESEIEKLKNENIELLKRNEELEKLILHKDSIINKTIIKIDSLIQDRDSLDIVITKINKNRNETHNYVDSLDDNGITSGISDYINRRKNKN